MDIFVSSGDINGTSLELILKNHEILSKKYKIIYCVDEYILQEAKELLGLKIKLDSLNLVSVEKSLKNNAYFKNLDSSEKCIRPGKPSAFSGFYSFHSFNLALKLALKSSQKIVTMPINKYCWNLAHIKFTGHTDYLRYFFKKDAIMMLGNKKMFVALFSDHIPLRAVAKSVTLERFNKFLLDFYQSFLKQYFEKNKKIPSRVLVLGLNPHAGDNGVIGKEDFIILDSINFVNETIKKDVFAGPVPGDCAFIKQNRKIFKIFIAPYHDLGLATLKALYFDDSINISLNTDIKRTSPDHGSGYDLAYKNSSLLSSKSYIKSVEFVANM